MSHDAHNPTSQPPPGNPRERLDAYLDGLLTGDELHAFEKILADDPSLQAEIDAQRSINNSLTRLFQRADPIRFPSHENGVVNAPPATIHPPQLRIAGDTGAPKTRTPLMQRNLRMPALLAVAAALAFTFAGLYFSGWIRLSDYLGRSESFVSPQSVYQRKVATGFTPDWVCETDEQFIQTTTDNFGEPLLVRSTDAVQVVGWSYYEPVLSASTLILLAKADGANVIVVMDRKVNDRPINWGGCGSLNHFRQEFGDVVMYEITPLAEPRILPLVKRQ